KSCFKTEYESAVTNYVGQDPDLAQGATTGTTLVQSYGVAPIDVSSFLTAGTQSVKFELMDIGFPPDQQGAFLGSATVHLFTNCTSGGVQSGGTVTGNPLDPNQPGSLTQDFALNTAPNKHIILGANFIGANLFDGVTTPTVTDTGLTQDQFALLVA